jgi:hypothetical protein
VLHYTHYLHFHIFFQGNKTKQSSLLFHSLFDSQFWLLAARAIVIDLHISSRIQTTSKTKKHQFSLRAHCICEISSLPTDRIAFATCRSLLQRYQKIKLQCLVRINHSFCSRRILSFSSIAPSIGQNVGRGMFGHTAVFQHIFSTTNF